MITTTPTVTPNPLGTSPSGASELAATTTATASADALRLGQVVGRQPSVAEFAAMANGTTPEP